MPAVAAGCVVAAAALAALPQPAAAQYFGRNKVKYETFDFRIMQAPHFNLYFYPAESTATGDGARMAERWYARFSTYLRHQFNRRSIIFFANAADFQQNNVTDIESEGTGGVTEGFRERVLLPFTGVYAENDHVIGHELVHVFQYDISNNQEKGGGAGGGNGGGGTPRGGGLGLNALPLWLVEGMAEYLSLGRDDPNTAMWLRDAARRNDIPSIKQLTNDPRYFPYRYGQALWAYVGGQYGDQAVVSVFRAALARGFEPAIRATLGMSADSLAKEWATAIRAAYLPIVRGRTPPESTATRVVFQRERRGGEYNTSPVVSPDGRYVAFFSSRGLFGIQIYIADASTGRVIKQLGSINSPRHYDALSFINSAGSWSPDGQRLAYVVYSGGNQVLDVYDLRRNRSVRQITGPRVGAAYDPAWSPDGRYIAFSGSTGGIADLYLYDFETGRTEALTSGRNAELQPAWSPDGRTLVFATDRGAGTDFARLTSGPMRLATLDMATRRITLLPTLAHGKQINPQYSPDGRSVYFVGDPDGIPDIYRLDLATGSFFRVTRVATGVSGITSLSPAISVARQTGRLVFSVFDRQGYDVLRLEQPEAAGTPVTTVALTDAGQLPPVPPRTASIVEAFRSDPLTGLPPEGTQYAVVPYRPALALDYIAPPTVGASFGGPFGTQVGGGIAASFSDQLGNNNLIAVLQAQGQIQDIGGQVIYQNLRRRWNYGAVVGRIPFLIGYSTYAQDQSGGVMYQQILQRIYFNQAGVFAQYPFSTIRRMELSATATRQSFRVDAINYPLNAFGQIVGQQRQRLPAPPALTYAQGAAAFVTDYSYFGLTSPVAGGRSRFQIAPTVGSLNFTTAQADYRRYLFFRPVTFAVRGMSVARFGRDAENTQRLYPLFVGYPTLIRGYDPYNFTAGECVSQGASTSSCPVFNRLSGSRIALANAELRIPLLGPAGLGIIRSRLLPVEVAPFFDAGLAWSRGQRPDLRFVQGAAARNATTRIPVFSTGITTRINVLGFAVLEAYYVYPFQRPDKGAYFGFQLIPGW